MGGNAGIVKASPISGMGENTERVLAMSRGLAQAATEATPEARRFDINELQSIANREAILNALNSQEMERRLDPDTLATRRELASQISGDLAGNPNQALSNMWLRQGLQDVVATGADTGSGFARSALADKTRQSFMDERAALQGRAAAYLQANPQPVAGLDVGSLVGGLQQTRNENATNRDAHRQQVLSFLGSQAQNVNNAFQQAMQMEAARKAQNAQAANAINAQNTSGTNALIGSGIGAVGSAAGAALVAF